MQTAEERSKLVYRVRITVDNKDGVLKQGMPVEAEIALSPQSESAVKVSHSCSQSQSTVHGRIQFDNVVKRYGKVDALARRVVQRRAAARCSG